MLQADDHYNHTNPINPTTAAIDAAGGTPASGAAFVDVSALLAEALSDELEPDPEEPEPESELDPEPEPEPEELVALAEWLGARVEAALMAEVAVVGL